MLTDDALSGLLRQSFADATSDLTAPTDLVSVIRHRHSAAQRRRTSVRIAVPAVAAASITAVLAAPHQHPPAPRAAVRPPTQLRSTDAVPVSYRVGLPAHPGTLGCVPRPTVPNAIISLYADGSCAGQAAAVIIRNATLPADAKPLTIGTLTGLYGLIDGHTRTVWARNTAGTFSSVTVNVATPDRNIATFFTTPN